MRDTTRAVRALAILEGRSIRGSVSARSVLLGLALVAAAGAAVLVNAGRTAGGSVISSTALDLHSPAHNNVTSVPVGTVVHPRVVITGTGATPTGTVVITRYPNSTCTGAPSATSTSLPLADGLLHATGFTFGPTAGGTHSWRASYSGGGIYAPTQSACEPVTFTKLVPTVRTRVHDDFHILVASVGPNTRVHGYATVSGTLGTPTGQVTQLAYQTADCTGSVSSAGGTLVAGAAEITTLFSTISTGTRSFRAVYSGDGTYLAANGNCLAVSVSKLDAAVLIAVNDPLHAFADNWAAGMNLHVHAEVNGSSGVPSGTISVKRHAGWGCGQLNVASSDATLDSSGFFHGTSTWTYPLPGQYSVQVRYNGNATYAARVGCKNYTLVQHTPPVSLAVHNIAHAPITTIRAGSPFHLATTVGNTLSPPTGTVTFTLFANPDCSGPQAPIGTVPVGATGAVESPSMTVIQIKAWGVRGMYSGDALYKPTASPCQALTVTKAQASFTTAIENATHQLALQPPVGTAIHPRIQVSGALGTPGGTMTWQVWATNNCSGTAASTLSGPLDGGLFHPATSYTLPTGGTYSWRFSYSGNASYDAYTNLCHPLTVLKHNATLSVQLHNTAHQVVTTVPLGVAIHQRTTLSGPLGTPTGGVTFQIWAGSSCSGAPAAELGQAISAGVAHGTTAVAFPTAVTRAYRVSYSGDGVYNAGVSPCTQLAVTKGDPGVGSVIHDAAHAPVSTGPVGTYIHPKATVAGFGATVPTGTVSGALYQNSTCSGSAHVGFTPASLVGGSVELGPAFRVAAGVVHSVRLTYSGDANYLGEAGPCITYTATKISISINSAFHNAAHSIVTSAPVGTVIHARTVTSGAAYPPTGTVKFRWYTDAACATTAFRTDTITIGSNVAETAGLTQLVAGSLWMRAEYQGNAGYLPTLGSCIQITFTKISATMTLDVHSSSHLVVTSAPIGTNVHPAITLSGYLGVPTGSVQFRWYTNGTCSGDGDATTGAINGGSLDATGVVATLDVPGTGSFRATWGGDATHNAATSPCAAVDFNEKLEAKVELIVHDAAHATVATVPEGTSIHPRAAVSGSGPTPTGSLRFRWYDDIECGRIATATSSVVALAGAVVDGTGFTQTPLNAGTVAFIAEYSGDAQYNGAVSDCELVTVVFEGPTVESFLPDVPLTGATTLTWSLAFDQPITGLAATDLAVGGVSTGWAVSDVTGSGTDWTITTQAPNPTHGTLVLTLAADAVANGDDRSGPNEPFASGAAMILPFSDITGSTFREDIVWLFESGITTGCGPRIYCPVAPVTRAQMASFLARGLGLEPTPIDFFDDDDGTTHEDNINRIAAAGITLGCGPSKYCPTANVTRGEMASFLVRALGLTEGGDIDAFGDDDGSTHEININRLKFAGLTTGCSPTAFCPLADVTRGQMAAFLHRALEE